jgi:rubrerythrin
MNPTDQRFADFADAAHQRDDSNVPQPTSAREVIWVCPYCGNEVGHEPTRPCCGEMGHEIAVDEETGEPIDA